MSIQIMKAAGAGISGFIHSGIKNYYVDLSGTFTRNDAIEHSFTVGTVIRDISSSEEPAVFETCWIESYNAAGFGFEDSLSNDQLEQLKKAAVDAVIIENISL